uniref:Uncharacterized protein n=1 Tax=Chenopodium quinoa TaxID=63459 RepID=A0A803KQE0_CHEQI
MKNWVGSKGLEAAGLLMITILVAGQVVKVAIHLMRATGVATATAAMNLCANGAQGKGILVVCLTDVALA